MTEHTPGPWRIKPEPSNVIGCRTIQGPKYETHQQAQHNEIACTVGLANDDRDKANADLIAAAPETAAERDRLREINNHLMEALEDISEGVGAFSMDPLTHAKNCIREMRLTASTAIAKAGETA